MGNFYVNYTLKGASQQTVAAVLTGRPAVVSPPAADAIVVFDAESDRQNQDQISQLAAKLSSALQCPVLAVMNHDDDILWYQLHHSGNLVDAYDSCPDYFSFDGIGEPQGPTGGDATKLCEAFGSGSPQQVEIILRKSLQDGYVFAFQRHLDLVKALGLPECAVANNYASFKRGVTGLPPGQVVRTS